MTTPPPTDPYDPNQPPPTPPPPYSPDPYPPGPYPPVGYPMAPVPTPYPVPPFIEPYTGLPYSDKSKLTAGLLQLLLGVLLGLGGVGRLYAGQTGLGVVQVVLSVVGWVSVCCASFLFFPIFLFFGLWLWWLIDGIVILAGHPVDGQGRPLR